MSSRRFPRVADTAQERRAHIVDATRQLVASMGLEGVSVRTVAARAGCSRGLVEHYFKTKAELIIAANAAVNESYLRRVAGATPGLQGMAALEARLRTLLPFSEEVLDEWRARVAFWRQGSMDEEISAAFYASFNAVYEEILADMRQAQAAGELGTAVPVQEAAETVLLMLIGLGTACLSDARLRAPRPLERRIQMILGMLRSGTLDGLQVGDPAIEY